MKTTSLSAERFKNEPISSKKNTHDLPQDIDYSQYLDRLEMSADIQLFSPVYLERITQLLNKTHQFNLTNKQYTLIDIERITQDAEYIGLCGRLKDRYGDHGHCFSTYCS